MDRRRFLSMFGLGVAGIALGEAIPFNRVWSFPSKIVVPNLRGIEFLQPPLGGFDKLVNTIDYGDEFANAWNDSNFRKQFKIGTTIRIRIPERFIVRHFIGDFSQPEKFKEFTVGGEVLESPRQT